MFAIMSNEQLLLQMWGDRLNGRSQQEKLGFSGKMASAIHRQTVEYIKPLFRKLKKKVCCQFVLFSFNLPDIYFIVFICLNLFDQ